MLKTINGYFGKYSVSSNGIIYSNKYNNTDNAKELRQIIESNGYARVNLCINGKATKKLVHRIVAEAFVENIDNKPCINHIDGNKQNNNVENL